MDLSLVESSVATNNHDFDEPNVNIETFNTPINDEIENKNFSISLDKLYTIIENQYKDKLLIFKKRRSYKQNCIEEKIKSVEKEIDLRVNVLKSKLDTIKWKFKNDLQEIENDLTQNNGETRLEKYYEKRLKNLRDDLMRENFNEKNYKNYLHDYNKLKELILNLNLNDYQIEFKVSNQSIYESIIGTLEYKNEQKNFKSVIEFFNSKILQTSFKIKNSIENDIKFETIDVSETPFDICELPDNRILCADCDGKKLILYDRNFNLLKMIKKINRKPFQPTSITTNFQKKQIYISDVLNNKILLVDLNFNLIKSTNSTRGDSSNDFCSPFSICFKHNSLYVCDTFNSRLKIYTNDLKLIEIINLSIKPFSVQVSDVNICINCKYFYDINTLLLERTNDRYFNRVSEINSCFYACDFNADMLLCYDRKGNLNWILHQPLFSYMRPNGKFFIFNDFLFLTSYVQKKFYKYKL